MSSTFDIGALMEEASEDEWDNAELSDSVSIRARRFRAQPGYKRSRDWRSGVKTTLLEKPICAIDGEGKTRENGRHDYTLLAAVWPGGRRCIEKPALSTEDCFDFILELPEDHVYLGYGLSYDTNMWLLPLPNGVVNDLLDRKQTTVRYRQYSIDWVERKYMTIRAYGKTRTVYDVLAFFQVPFVSPNPAIVKGACDAWLPEYTEEIAHIRVMKDLRGKFQHVADERIQEYTYLECEMLERLMRKFIDALRSTKLKPRALYGPGALAAAALEKYGVKKHMATLPEPLPELTRRAYFGGRFDAALFGWLTECFQYDIRSAYPHQIRSLPCLKCAAWTYHKTSFDTLNPSEYGMYHVEWKIDPHSRWGPFPHRTEKGLIYYPYEGAGWYHADEVKAAIACYNADAIKVLEGWELVRQCDHKPFDFVVSLYALRKELESSGNVDQGIIIKLVLNSLYGKLAQQVGMRKGKPPPFQCFFWAGAITAGTRAQILRVLTWDADSVIGIATDGIVATEMLDMELGEALGQWECKELAEYAQISNGVYHAVDIKGKHIDRARGLGRGVLDFSKKGALYKQWRKTRGCGRFRYQGRTRFITLREARNRQDRDDVKCRWLDEERELSFAPARRFPWPDPEMRKRDLMGTILLSYEEYDGERESQPFRVKTDSAEVHEKRAQWQGISWLHET